MRNPITHCVILSVFLASTMTVCPTSVLADGASESGTVPGDAAPSSAPTESVSDEKIAALVARLGSETYQDREQATRALWEIGPAAEPALAKARSSTDAEVAWRARDILDRFAHGILPGVSDEVVKILERYRAGNNEIRRAALSDLANQGREGFEAIGRLSRIEKDDKLRQTMHGIVREMTRRVIPEYISSGRFDHVSPLLRTAAMTGDGQAIRDMVAFELSRGNMKALIDSLEEDKADTPHMHMVRAYAWRAAGNLDKAVEAAEASKNDHLVLSLLIEQHNWKRVAQVHEKLYANRADIETLGLTAAYARLSNDQKQYENALAGIKQRGDDSASRAFYAAEALLLNDEVEPALAMLRKRGMWQSVHELLTRQQRFAEAEGLLKEAAKAGNTEDAFTLQRLNARMWARHGEVPNARATFAALANAARKRAEGEDDQAAAYARQLFVATDAFSLGLNDLGFKIFEQAQDSRPRGVDDQSIESHALATAFGVSSAQIRPLWQALAKHKADMNVVDRLKLLHALFTGRLDDKQYDVVVEAALGSLVRNESELRKDLATLYALADAAMAMKKPADRISYLKQATKLSDSASPWMQLAHAHLDQQQYAEAAKALEKLIQLDPLDPEPVFLLGICQLRKGDKDAADRMIQRARMMPLGNESQRFRLAVLMGSFGLEQQSERELTLLLRTAEFGDYFGNRALRAMAVDGDHTLAAHYLERGRLGLHRMNTSMVDIEGYLIMTHRIARHHMLAALADKRFDAAIEHARLAARVMPNNIDITIDLVLALEGADRNTDADTFFKQAVSHYASVCTKFPRYAQGRNAIAWLCARVRRQLDEAATHARIAVKLQPRNTAYIDTLAEVMFQQGKNDEAIQLMKQCLELEPNRPYFQRQLKRFEKGDRSTSPEE